MCNNTHFWMFHWGYMKNFCLLTGFMIPYGDFRVVKSQRGNALIFYNNYTYGRCSKTRWLCSTHKPECKAYIRQYKNGEMQIIGAHNHGPRKYILQSDGRLSRIS